jgi:predicted Zn-dependent protease
MRNDGLLLALRVLDGPTPFISPQHGRGTVTLTFARSSRAELTMMKTLSSLIASVLMLGCASSADVRSVAKTSPSSHSDRAAHRDPEPELAGNAKYLADLDRHIAYYRDRAASSNQWIDYEQLVALHLSRARYGGRFEDYLEADRAVARAFELAPEGGKPHMARATLGFTLHRFGAIEADLQAVERFAFVPAGVHDAIGELRADLAFQLGRYDEAHAAFERYTDERPSSANYLRLAYYHWKTGDDVRADAYLVQAQERAGDDAQAVASIELQRGLLDLERGRLAQAERHYRRADALYPHWYLIEEHLAEVMTETGRLVEAQAIYERVLAETQNPEFMDALAHVHELRGDHEQAERHSAMADAAFDRQFEALPEALAGHAFEHYLERAPPARVVEIAERNHAVRPNPEAKLQLAQAYLRAGRVADAERAIDDARRTPFSSPELFGVSSIVNELGGNHREAAADRERAEAMREGVMEELAFLRVAG